MPAKLVGAWLGVDGPEPFDSGNSDYERACDARRPALIAVGAGHGLALPGQGVDVYAEPEGLLLAPRGWAEICRRCAWCGAALAEGPVERPRGGAIPRSSSSR